MKSLTSRRGKIQGCAEAVPCRWVGRGATAPLLKLLRGNKAWAQQICLLLVRVVCLLVSVCVLRGCAAELLHMISSHPFKLVFQTNIFSTFEITGKLHSRWHTWPLRWPVVLRCSCHVPGRCVSIDLVCISSPSRLVLHLCQIQRRQGTAIRIVSVSIDILWVPRLVNFARCSIEWHHGVLHLVNSQILLLPLQFILAICIWKIQKHKPTVKVLVWVMIPLRERRLATSSSLFCVFAIVFWVWILLFMQNYSCF